MNRFWLKIQDSSVMIQGSNNRSSFWVIWITMLTLQIGNPGNMGVISCLGPGNLRLYECSCSFICCFLGLCHKVYNFQLHDFSFVFVHMFLRLIFLHLVLEMFHEDFPIHTLSYSWELHKVLISESIYNTIHMYSGITSGRVLNGELLYTKILEVNLFAFAYRLFRRDFSPLDGTYCMGTHSFLQPYIHFVLIWEGFMNGQSWSRLPIHKTLPN